MVRLKATFVAIIASLMVFGFMPAAQAQSESNAWLEVNAPPSYCGWAANSIVNDDVPGPTYSLTSATGTTSFRPAASCSFAAPTSPLPADSLRVSISLKCKTGPNSPEFLAASSVEKSNLSNTGTVSVSFNQANYCGSSTGGVNYPRARVIVTSKFFIFPTGWGVRTETSHWMDAT